MDTEAEENIDFKTLRAKFQKSDIIRIKSSGKQPLQTSEAPGVACPKTALNVTNINIFETVPLHDAAVQQTSAQSPPPPVPLVKPTVVPKPVLLKLPDWTDPSDPDRSGRKPEDLTSCKGASLRISSNNLQKSENQTSESRLSKDNVVNDQLNTISFKEKLNIWENSLHCNSAPVEKIKCDTLPPSLLNSGAISYFSPKAICRADPLSRTISVSQNRKGDRSMDPEIQVSGARKDMTQSMLIQSNDTSQSIDNCRIIVPILPPKMYLPCPQVNQKGLKLDDNTVESEMSSRLPLDSNNHREPKLPMDQGVGNAHEKDYQHTFLRRRELPSIEVLGPPPVKPPRPFNVYFGALQKIKMASCSPTKLSKKNGISSSSISYTDEYKILNTVSRIHEETNKKKEQQHQEVEQKNVLQIRKMKGKHQDQVKEYESKEIREKEIREKELQRKFNLTGLEVPIYKVQVQQLLKGGKLDLTVKPGEVVEIIRMVDCPTGKWLARTHDGNYGYIQIEAVKMDNAEIKEISKRILKQPETFEEIYDDVGLPEITPELCSTSPLQNVDSGQSTEAMDTKKESEKRNSGNKVNPLTKILQKGKEKKRMGHESSSYILQPELGPVSPAYDNSSNLSGSQKLSSSKNYFVDEEPLDGQVYDDAESCNSESLKKDRMKELGKLFKKEIGDGEREKKVKIRKDKEQDQLSANSRSQSTLSITNSESSASGVYEDLNSVKEYGDFEDRTSKSDPNKNGWANIFRKREENVKRTEEINTKVQEAERVDGNNEDGPVSDFKATREKVKGIFKGKRKDPNEEKETKVNKKKMLKEQEFREKFNYTKEIVVENIAVVEQNAVQEKKGSLYLPIKAGEKLEVIDIGEGNQIICRNSEGKYGYVHVRHLIFGNQN
ncbi:FYN-binding protein 1 isoform X3 [Chiloscyllium plagiosum]|uniref:FYN-binding protein 1 isoform X3 n=1 Tax=Chiloscyllium plagiosum TaxID=36176 RepID=UPI001CB81BFE|nr:FYN-binding protein 1 isoform X3 [Chiloscyllium plagiosum]